MTRKLRHLNFVTRSNAAMFTVYFRVNGATASDIAREQNISSTYARRLLQSWVRGGFIREVRTPYRKNVSMVTYKVQYPDSFEKMGYAGVCEESHKQMLAFVWNEYRKTVNAQYGRS